MCSLDFHVFALVLSYQPFAQFRNTIHSFIFREVIQNFVNCGLIADAAFSCQCVTSASPSRSRQISEGIKMESFISFLFF